MFNILIVPEIEKISSFSSFSEGFNNQGSSFKKKEQDENPKFEEIFKEELKEK